MLSEGEARPPSSRIGVCTRYCTLKTKTASYYALNKAVNIFLISLVLLCVGTFGSIVCIVYFAISKDRTVEMSFSLVLTIIEFVIGGCHILLLKKRTKVFCVISMVLNFLLIIFLLAFMILVVASEVVNPLVVVLPFVLSIIFVHGFSAIADLNLLRFLHASEKHWLGTHPFQEHSLHFTESERGPGNAQDVDLMEVRIDPPLGERNPQAAQQSSEPYFDESSEVDTDVVNNNDGEARVVAGRDPSLEDNVYPESKNPFYDDALGEVEVEAHDSSYIQEVSSLSVADVQNIGTIKRDPVDNASEPPSEYLIDVELPTICNARSDLPEPHLGVPKQERRGKHRRPMQYCFLNEQTRIILPDGGLIVPFQPSTLHRTASIIVEKSNLPVPEYRERANFINYLPNTVF